MRHRRQRVKERARQRRDVFGDTRELHFLEQVEAGVERGDAEEVRRAVLERFVARAEAVRVDRGRHVEHRAAGEPRAAQFGERVAPRDERAEAGRIAEEFVERERGEVGEAVAQRDRLARRECGDVEQHVESVRVRMLDERERVPHAGEVRLRGKGEKAAVARRFVRDDRLRAGEAELVIERQVPNARAGVLRVLAHAVDRVVVIGREQERRVAREGIALRDELDRGARVRGEDDVVRRGVDAEEAEDALAGGVDDRGARARRRGVGVRIAEESRFEDPLLRAELRRAVKRAAGVIEIDVVHRVEPRELAAAQLVEGQHPRLRIAATRSRAGSGTIGRTSSPTSRSERGEPPK